MPERAHHLPADPTPWEEKAARDTRKVEIESVVRTGDLVEVTGIVWTKDLTTGEMEAKPSSARTWWSHLEPLETDVRTRWCEYILREACPAPEEITL